MRIIFFGTPEFAVPSLRALAASGHDVVLAVAQPDRPAGRGMKLQSPPVAVVARELNIPVIQPPKIRTPEFLESMSELRPDLAVVVAYGRILPENLLAIPHLGFVNVHASLLPKYRGAAPIQRAIQFGESETGVTLMRIDAELDHGPMLAIASTPIDRDERAPAVSARLAALGADLLAKTLPAIENRSVVETEQNHAAATYAHKIEKEESRVDLTQTAKAIYDRYRAFDPWPGVNIEAGGEVLKLASIAHPPVAILREPGTVLGIDAESMLVATGDGPLRFDKVQRPGGRPITGAEYARSRGLKAGDSIR